MKLTHLVPLAVSLAPLLGITALVSCGDDADPAGSGGKPGTGCAIVDDLDWQNIDCAGEVVQINGSLVLSNPGGVTRFDASFPKLQRVEGLVRIGPNARVELPALTSVGSDVMIETDATNGAWSLDLKSLTTVGGSFVVLGDSIGELSIPLLQEVGSSLRVESPKQLRQFVAPALATLKGRMLVYGSKLERVELPLLQSVGGDLDVYDNSALAVLNLAQLSAITGTLKIADNPALPGCVAKTLSAQLSVPCEPCTGNQDAGICK